MSTISDYEQNQMDAQMGREMDAHAENLKRSLEAGRCPRCMAQYTVGINPKNITFKCNGGPGYGRSVPCGWFAIYPIATIGNSSPLHTENAALKEEVAALKSHIENLNHDFAASLAECDAHHVDGREQ